MSEGCVSLPGTSNGVEQGSVGMDVMGRPHLDCLVDAGPIRQNSTSHTTCATPASEKGAVAAMISTNKGRYLEYHRASERAARPTLRRAFGVAEATSAVSSANATAASATDGPASRVTAATPS
eukprot:scaffold28332_cov31-Tisochrysis_lutea.AAC.11